MPDFEIGTYHNEESEYLICCKHCSKDFVLGSCLVVVVTAYQHLVLFKDYECTCGTSHSVAVFHDESDAAEDVQRLRAKLLKEEEAPDLSLRPIEESLPGWDVPEGTHTVH